jgi:hypothetical protein
LFWRQRIHDRNLLRLAAWALAIFGAGQVVRGIVGALL